jgi:hypothetical protein
MNRHWVTAKEAGEYFGLPQKTFYSLAARRLLPQGSFIYFGRSMRFDIDLLESGLGKKLLRVPNQI